MTKAFGGTAFAAALLAATFLSPWALAQSGEEAQVRVAHLSLDTPHVYVYVNDELVDTLTDVPFGTVSSYVPLPAGVQDLKLYPDSDASEPLVETDVDVQGGAAYTVGVVSFAGDQSFAAEVYEDDNSLPADDNAKLRVITAVPDVGGTYVRSPNGNTLFADLGFPNATTYAEVAAGIYSLEATATDADGVRYTADLALSADTVYTAFVIGSVKEGTLSLKLVEDAGAGGELRGVDTTVPDTGGIVAPSQLLAMGAGLVILATIIRLWARR